MGTKLVRLDFGVADSVLVGVQVTASFPLPLCRLCMPRPAYFAVCNRSFVCNEHQVLNYLGDDSHPSLFPLCCCAATYCCQIHDGQDC